MSSTASEDRYEPQADTTLRLFERGQLDFNGLFPQEVMTYESNIAYTLRFMIDTKVGHCQGSSC